MDKQVTADEFLIEYDRRSKSLKIAIGLVFIYHDCTLYLNKMPLESLELHPVKSLLLIPDVQNATLVVDLAGAERIIISIHQILGLQFAELLRLLLYSPHTVFLSNIEARFRIELNRESKVILDYAEYDKRRFVQGCLIELSNTDSYYFEEVPDWKKHLLVNINISGQILRLSLKNEFKQFELSMPASVVSLLERLIYGIIPI